jgi:hypothetical protein
MLNNLTFATPNCALLMLVSSPTQIYSLIYLKFYFCVVKASLIFDGTPYRTLHEFFTLLYTGYKVSKLQIKADTEIVDHL